MDFGCGISGAHPHSQRATGESLTASGLRKPMIGLHPDDPGSIKILYRYAEVVDAW